MRALLAVGRLPRGESRRLVLAILLAAGATGAAIALLATSGELITRAAHRPEVISLMVMIVAVRSFGLARATLRYVERLVSHELTLRQLARLRIRFFAALEPLVPGGVARRGRGELLARFVADVETLADLYLRVLIPVLVALAVVLGVALTGWLMLPLLGVVLLAALAADGLAGWSLAAVGSARSAARQAPVRAALTERMIEGVDGAAELAVLGAGPRRADELAALDGRLARLGRRDATVAAVATVVHEWVSGAGLIAVLMVAVAASHHGTLSGLLVATAAFLALGAREALEPLPDAAQRAHACRSAAQRLHEVTVTAPPVTDPEDPTAPPVAPESLAVENVSFRYAPDTPEVLCGASLRLAAGEHVALLGPSGAGKSTIGELLVRFRDPDGGAITLDGVDLRRLRQDDVRAAVLLCGQDGDVFNTSLRENLLIGDRSADEAALWRVLEVVELTEWAHALPAGLDTQLGQYGEAVSGGQRQRIALARALLSPARFLVLDESTAHLDGPLARRVLAQVLAAAGDRGVLFITHDRDAAALCRRVVELREGRILRGPSLYPAPDSDAGSGGAEGTARSAG